MALCDYPEGLWVFSVDRREEILPIWWDQQVRSRIRPLGEIKEEVRREGYRRRPSPTTTTTTTTTVRATTNGPLTPTTAVNSPVVVDQPQFAGLDGNGICTDHNQNHNHQPKSLDSSQTLPSTSTSTLTLPRPYPQPHPPLSSHRSAGSAEGVPSIGVKRTGYDDTDEDEEIKCAAEVQWVMAVDVLIQMANWVSVSGRLLLERCCRCSGVRVG
jgi:hypothetical protein